MPDHPTVVIGAGPTGVATLFYAALEGMPAVGVEVAPNPLPDVHEYLRDLTLASPSEHFEVAGLPLDCRNRLQLTREDVLSYYTRLISYGRLDIRCRHRFTGITFETGRPVVHVESPRGQESWVASNVLITNWARRRPIPESWLGHLPTVVSGIDDVTRCAAKRIVIVGGGLSAYEQAVALMFTGQTVTVIARRTLHRSFGHPVVRRLAAATCSSFVDNAIAIAVDDEGVRFRVVDDSRVAPCDVVVACLGREVCPETAQLLLRLGVIDEGTAAAVQHAVLDARIDETNTSKLPTPPRWPDLWRQLVVGFQGVRIVGNGLHPGGAGAGVGMATLSGFLALQAILGRDFPPYVKPPLPAALSYAAATRLPETFDWFSTQRGFTPDLIGQIRPLAIHSWSRMSIASLPIRGVAFGGGATYLVGQPDLPVAVVADLLRRCDGTRSIDELAQDAGLARDALVRSLRKLWTNNALTWLPPADGFRRLQRIPTKVASSSWHGRQ